MFSAENAKRELYGHGGRQPLTLDGQAVPAPGADDQKAPLALPAPSLGDNGSQQEDEPRVLEVGGESVKIDKLGPLIVNTDGVRSALAAALVSELLRALTMVSSPRPADALADHELARANAGRAGAHDPARRQEAQQVCRLFFARRQRAGS